MPTYSAAVLSGEPIPAFRPENVRDPDLVENEQIQRNRQAWVKFIDANLVEWGKDPTALEDEDFIPPSLDVINLACNVAVKLRNEGHVPPTRVIPDGEGGISFEWVEEDISHSLNMYADQTAELLTFDDCRLRERRRLL
ncbi:MAG: hypothetical protein SVV80_03825 [Planctomycetota bacterium]|nr:hypothetical protein [Planctomycetota bacterium]